MPSRPVEIILSRHWPALVSVGVFSLFFNALMLTLPIYMLSIFSNVLTSKNADTLWLLTLVAAFALLLQALVDAFRSRLLVRVGLSVEAAVAPGVLDSLIEHRRELAHHESRALGDAGELRRFVSDTHLMALIDLPFVPLYLTVIAWLHPVLGALALAGALLHLLIAALGDFFIRRPMREASEARERNRELTDDVLRNSDLVRSMGMMSGLASRLRQLGNTSLLWFQQSADRASALRAMVRATRIGLQIALYCAGAWLFLSDQVMVGAIVAASVLLGRVMTPIDSAIPAWRAALKARDAFRRLDAVLRTPVAEPGLGRAPDASNPARFDLRRATVRAPGSSAVLLNRVSLLAQPGELVGVVGATGSGKSALGRLIAGAWPPAGGSFSMNGRSASEWSLRERASMMGYCPQEPYLLAGTLAENIARFQLVEGGRDDVVRAARAVGLDAAVSALPDAYSSRVGHGGMSLPAGMRQQVALARAFYGDPGLLVLDEPAAWLDHAGQQALLGAVDQARARGAAVVIITHQPALLKNASRIVVMNGGAIEFAGPADKVMAHLAGRRSAASQGVAQGTGSAARGLTGLPGPVASPSSVTAEVVS